MLDGLVKVRPKRVAELAVERRLGHLRERVDQLVLGAS